MAVATTNAFSGPFTANGSTTIFPFTFTVLSGADVTVVLRDADGVETTVSANDYSVTLTGDGPSAGSVTFDVAPATGNTVWLYLDPDFTQETEFVDGHPFIAGAVNDANDRAALRDQVLRRDVDRALLVPIGEAGVAFPTAAARADRALFFDANGDPDPQSLNDFSAAAAAQAVIAEAWAEGTLPGGAGTKSAKEWSEVAEAEADAAALSAVTAEAAAGPTYASTAAGLAATTSGEAFAVDAGDGTVTVYLNSAGVAVAQRNLATVAYNNARYPLKIGPEFTLSGAFTYSADFFNPTDDYVRSDCMVRATDSGSHPGKIRFGQFISADSGGTSPNGPANAFVGFGLSNIKTNFLSSTTTQETDGLFIQTKTGRFGDTSAILADAWAVNVPGVSTSFSNLIEGAAGCFDTSGVVVSKIRFQAGNQYQAGTPGSILGVGCHIIAEVGAQYSALDIDNTPGVGSWTYAMRVEKDGVQKFQIFSNGYVGINGTANIEIPLLVNADVSSELAARFYSTDAGPGEGPIVNLFRESATPANNDSLGLITFDGMDSANTQTTFAAVRAVAVNVTNGSEQGGLYGLVNSNGSLVQTFAAFRDSFYISGPLLVNGVQVIGPRKTGWGTPTGTATRTTFDTATVTTAQLAERLKALIDDLILHGVIGA